MEINIEDYIDKDEMKRIVTEEFQDKIREYFRENTLSSLVYLLCDKEISKTIEEEIPNFREKIKQRISPAIESIDKYNIFQKKDNFIYLEDSLGQKMLEEVIKENKDILEQKVKNIFLELSKKDIATEIECIITDKIENMFKNDSGETNV